VPSYGKNELKHLILPVETTARELDAKLLLALHATKRGIMVTLGNKALLNLDISKLEPGIYLSHNFNAGRDRIIAIARQLGHRVVAWDEEGLVWINEAVYRSRRTSRRAIANIEAIFAWGQEQVDALEPATRGMPVKVVTTGNPRADLLRPEMRPLYTARVGELKAEFGDFVLINSNFGWINHALFHGDTGKDGKDLDVVAAKSGFPVGYLQHRHAIYREFVNVLPEISKRFSNRRIVIRPHPSESNVGWLKASEGLPNVTVRYDSELVPWLMAASHIIHNGCTTAVEAAMLDRVAISFRPIIAPEYEIPQPRRVSIEAGNAAQLIKLLATKGLTDNPPADRKAVLEHMVISMSGPSSSARIAKAIDALFEDPFLPPPRWLRGVGHAAAIVRRAEKFIKHFHPGAASNPAYYSHKFPPISEIKILARLQSLAVLTGAATPKVREISDRIFRITPA
jgi:surface carbohydrate biosynthesis protein